VEVPTAKPVTIPDEPTKATMTSLELHAPPAGVPTSVIVEPVHTVLGPDIDGAGDDTVSVLLLEQPVGNV